MVLETAGMKCDGNENQWRESHEFDHKNGEVCGSANKTVALPYSSVVQNRVKHDDRLVR
jgi:hypothetical protein